MERCKCCGHIPEQETDIRNRCPDCGEFTIIQLPSMNKKICTNCQKEFDWHLKEGQKSVLINNLVGGRHV